MARTVTVARAKNPQDLDAVRALIRDFFAWALELAAIPAKARQ